MRKRKCESSRLDSLLKSFSGQREHASLHQRFLSRDRYFQELLHLNAVEPTKKLAKPASAAKPDAPKPLLADSLFFEDEETVFSAELGQRFARPADDFEALILYALQALDDKSLAMAAAKPLTQLAPGFLHAAFGPRGNAAKALLTYYDQLCVYYQQEVDYLLFKLRELKQHILVPWPRAQYESMLFLIDLDFPFYYYSRKYAYDDGMITCRYTDQIGGQIRFLRTFLAGFLSATFAELVFNFKALLDASDALDAPTSLFEAVRYRAFSALTVCQLAKIVFEANGTQAYIIRLLGEEFVVVVNFNGFRYCSDFFAYIRHYKPQLLFGSVASVVGGRTMVKMQGKEIDCGRWNGDVQFLLTNAEFCK